jgi:hypothetical protein
VKIGLQPSFQPVDRGYILLMKAQRKIKRKKENEMLEYDVRNEIFEEK